MKPRWLRNLTPLLVFTLAVCRPQILDAADAPAGESHTNTLALVKGIRLGGLVQNESSQPVPGVKVRIPTLDSFTFGPRERYEWGATGSKPVITDIAGRWSFDGAPPDVSAAVLEFEHPDYRRARAHTEGAPTSTGVQIALEDLKSAQATVTLKRRLTLTVSAIDTASQTPLNSFVATPGYATGRSIRWDARQSRRTNRGKILFSTENDDSELPSYIRAQADGKASHVVCVSSVPSSGELAVTVPLSSGPEIAGTACSANGQPLANAHVALLTEFAGATVRQTNFLRTADLITTRTDSQGRFRFPSTPEAHSVAVLHEQGFAEIPVANSADPVELRLQAWGRVQGRLRVRSAGPQDPLALFLTASPFVPRLFRQPRLGALTLDIGGYATETDANGAFALSPVPPGNRILWHTVKLENELPVSENTVCFNGVPVEVPPGLGLTWEEKGASLRARLQSGDRTAPIPPNASLSLLELQPPDNTTQPALRRLFTCSESGLFRVTGLPQGRFLVTLRTFAPPHLLGTARREILVPESNPSDPTLDLGDWTITPAKKPQVGDSAPPIELATPDGKTIRIADLRGRHVLLHFWTQWSGARATSFPALQELYASHSKNRRLEILCLNLDEDPADARRAIARNRTPWPQAHAGSWLTAPILEQYPASELPSLFLIDPEGRIVAADVSVTQAIEAARKALER